MITSQKFFVVFMFCMPFVLLLVIVNKVIDKECRLDPVVMTSSSTSLSSRVYPWAYLCMEVIVGIKPALLKSYVTPDNWFVNWISVSQAAK